MVIVMVNIYKTVNNELKALSNIDADCWIEMTSPSIDEINSIVSKTGVSKNLLTKLLDDEELPRIEKDKDTTLIVIDAPFLVENAYKNQYYTYPIGIVMKDNFIITISLRKITIFDDFINAKIKNFSTDRATTFIFPLLLKIASTYQRALKYVDETIRSKEKILKKSTQNRELLDLLNIEKTLVYFITSLKANDIVIDKLAKGNILKLLEEDFDILHEAAIENRQAIETANLYREILTSMTDTYATIISNNLNVVMKFLAGITIVFSIPTMIASFLGMNVDLGFIGNNPYSFIIIILISIILALLVAIILKKKDLL